MEAEAAVAAELAASGVHVALVSGLDIARDPRWGRCEECFGEDPSLAASMCQAVIIGMQGRDRSRIGGGGVAVVLKHLAAQGEAVGGRNGQSAIIGSRDLHEIHLPAVEAGVRAGAMGFMAAYNDIDGVPCCANPWLLRDYLRGELGFDGLVMADGLAVDRLRDMSGSIPDSGRVALLSGVDVSLWDDGFTHLVEYADAPDVMASIESAVQRVLNLKRDFGLLATGGDTGFDHAAHDSDRVRLSISGSGQRDGGDLGELCKVTSRYSQRLSQESLVLLKDCGAPDLSVCGIVNHLADGPVVVAGPFADDFACFLGDYTAPQPTGRRASVYSELAETFAATNREVVLLSDCAERERQVLAAASLVVAVLGGTSERAYDSDFAENGAALAVTEHGASGGEGVDAADVSLPWDQDGLIYRLHSQTSAPIVSVIVAGRAHVLTKVLECSAAVIWAGYAGPFGPQAVMKTLKGKNVPSGRMPVTLPSAVGAIPVRYNDRQPADGAYKDAPRPVLRCFGYGIGALRGAKVTGLHTKTTADTLVVSAIVATAAIPARGALNLFVRRMGLLTVPRLAELVGTVYLDMPARSQRHVEWRAPIDWLLRDAGASVRLHLWLDGELSSATMELARGQRRTRQDLQRTRRGDRMQPDPFRP
jgi:beta-glucosidase